ncbi:MAG: histidine phosphatase family protein [Pseudomonadota bacterium]
MGFRLVLLRHAEPRVAAGVCYGQLDVPLSSSGLTTARQYSGLLPPPRRLYCSDLERAKESAKLLFPSTKPLIDPRLREVSMGQWEGRRWDEIHSTDEQRMASWGQNWVAVAPPDGESAQQLFERTEEFLSECILTDDETEERGAEGDTVLVAHQGSLRAISCLLAGLSVDHFFSLSFSYLAAFTAFDLRR